MRLFSELHGIDWKDHLNGVIAFAEDLEGIAAEQENYEEAAEFRDLVKKLKEL